MDYEVNFVEIIYVFAETRAEKPRFKCTIKFKYNITTK